MPNTPNKIKYGLSNVHYAVAEIAADGSATYETPVRIPGAVSISLESLGEVTPEYADDIDYAELNGVVGYDGDLEVEIVPDSFNKDVFGDQEDANGVQYEDGDAPVVHFALLYEFAGDKHKTRRVLYNCTAKRPAEGSSTKGETIEPQHESFSIKARTVYNASVGKNIPKAKTNQGDSQYANWYQAVYQPTATAATSGTSGT